MQDDGVDAAGSLAALGGTEPHHTHAVEQADDDAKYVCTCLE